MGGILDPASTRHVEGGWPKEIDYSEAQDTLKYRKRLEKDLGDDRSKHLLVETTEMSFRDGI